MAETGRAGRRTPESKDNYTSAVDHKQKLLEDFEAQRKLGMFHTTSLAEAREEFGSNLHIAALAMLEQGEDSFRTVHDGTHGVAVNPRSKVRDQHTSPLGCDLEAVMCYEKTFGFLLSLVFDISKAHRRLSVLRKDWGLQACKPDALLDMIWLNTVGTFGIGSISYWWGTAAALLERLTHYLDIEGLRWLLIFADDVNTLVRSQDPARTLMTVIVVWLALGVPLKGRGFGRTTNASSWGSRSPGPRG